MKITAKDINIIGIAIILVTLGFLVWHETSVDNHQAVVEARLKMIEANNHRQLSWTEKVDATIQALENRQPTIKTITTTNTEIVPEYVPQPIIPREFESLDTLVSWLDANTLPLEILIGKDGEASFTDNVSLNRKIDCDDYATQLQNKAFKDGYIINQQLVLDGRIFGVKVSEHPEPHMGLITTIANKIYYIESVPPHSVVFVCYKDKE